jgi:hypothetical protein
MTEPHPTLVSSVSHEGIAVEFHLDRFTKDGKPRKSPTRWYVVNGETVASVTQILDVLHKPALVWWGMQIGVKGLRALRDDYENLLEHDEETLVELLTENKLTVNHIRDAAATRGQSVHAALEAFARERTIPSLIAFPEEDRGYVQALAQWLYDVKPEFLATEVMVGSAEHGYAGRYDLRVRLDGREGIVDAKTSKKVWHQSQMPQLAAYDEAAVECGAEPTDFQAVLRLDKDGSYELEESCATIEDFIAVKAAFDSQRDLNERVKSLRKDRRKAKVAA